MDPRRILVDAYNLDAAQGTGIRTYTRSLIAALRADPTNEIGALYARRLPRRGTTPILDEILFSDARTQAPSLIRSRRRRLASLAEDSVRALGSRRRRARRVSESFVVESAPSASQLAGIARYNVSGCYERAMLLYRFTGRHTEIIPPDPIDVWHATYPLPIEVQGARKITTIHDCVPLRLPYSTIDDKRLIYRLIERELHSSDVVLTVSEHSRADLLDLFAVDPLKIRVVHQPVLVEPLDEAERASLDPFLANRFQLENDGYVLFVGAIEPKKNVRRLIDAYFEANIELPLVIVGKRGWLWEDQLGGLSGAGADARRRVRLLRHVAERDLRRLYAGARFFVFPSVYEGLGLPPLEAMKLGTPALVSRAASLPEVCGDAASYVDPYNVQEIADALVVLSEDETLRDRLREAGHARAAEFSLDRFASEIEEMHRHVLGDRYAGTPTSA